MARTNQLVELLENYLLTPTSDFYISTILHNPDGKAADPFTAASVDLGVTPVMGVKVGITLVELLVKGLSNTQVKFDENGNPEITVNGNLVKLHAKVPNTQEGYKRPADVPDKIEMSGKLDITIDGKKEPQGTVTIVVKSVADVTASFVATEEVSGQLSSVKIAVKHIDLAPGTQKGNITFDVHLPHSAFSSVISEVLNQSGTQEKLIGLVNTKNNDEKILSKLSDAATKAGRSALSKITST